MSALDAFWVNWSQARATFGAGTPQTGEQFDESGTLRQLGSGLDAAAPGSRWNGSAATAYGTANSEHQHVIGGIADLDQRLGQYVTQSAGVVDNGRQNLDKLKRWTQDVAASVPPGSQNLQTMLQIASTANRELTDIVQTTNRESNTIAAGLRDLGPEYRTLGTDQRFAPGDEKSSDVDSLTDEQDEDGEEEAGEAGAQGAEDGQALADQAALPPADRDPAVLDRVASRLPESPLTEQQMAALAEGKEVSDVPKETLDYYRDFYKTSGKDGLLLLDRHLESQEAAGNAEAGAQRDRLANGLTVTSNENVVERNPDGSVASRGGYDQLPADLREMIETRRADPNYPGWETLGPTEAKNRHVADVAQFSELLGEANPGYQPGSRLSTELYLKSADMVENSTGGRAFTDTAPEVYERAANTFSEVAGRNNEASYQIWSGQGEYVPEGYNREETVRTLIGHDWSESGGEGSGAATLLDWITEDSQRPIGDPLGDRARAAMTEIPDLLAPPPTSEGLDPVHSAMRDAFARNDAISTEMGQLLAANTDSLAAPGSQQGFAQTKIDALGHPVFGAADGNRLLEFGSYSEEGRVTLATAAETARIDELEAALRDNPGNLSDQLANSAAGHLSGRIDQAMLGAIDHQNDVLQTDLEANDAVYRAKLLGAEIAGVATSELTGKIPHANIAADVTGVDPAQAVENTIKEWIDKPEYQGIQVPEAADLEAASTRQAQQAIVEAAHRAGQLPPILNPNGQPIDVAATPVGGDEWYDLQKYLVGRGLSQYVLDYGQSYSIVVE